MRVGQQRGGEDQVGGDLAQGRAHVEGVAQRARQQGLGAQDVEAAPCGARQAQQLRVGDAVGVHVQEVVDDGQGEAGAKEEEVEAAAAAPVQLQRLWKHGGARRGLPKGPRAPGFAQRGRTTAQKGLSAGGACPQLAAAGGAHNPGGRPPESEHPARSSLACKVHAGRAANLTEAQGSMVRSGRTSQTKLPVFACATPLSMGTSGSASWSSSSRRAGPDMARSEAPEAPLHKRLSNSAVQADCTVESSAPEVGGATQSGLLRHSAQRARRQSVGVQLPHPGQLSAQSALPLPLHRTTRVSRAWCRYVRSSSPAAVTGAANPPPPLPPSCAACTAKSPWGSLRASRATCSTAGSGRAAAAASCKAAAEERCPSGAASLQACRPCLVVQVGKDGAALHRPLHHCGVSAARRAPRGKKAACFAGRSREVRGH